MLHFSKALQSWNKPDFNDALKDEIAKININQLPLQQALAQSSYVSDTDFGVVILNASEEENNIIVKAGMFFFGIIAGSCCSDDPTPVDEVAEYCELEFYIDKENGNTSVSLI